VIIINCFLTPSPAYLHWPHISTYRFLLPLPKRYRFSKHKILSILTDAMANTKAQHDDATRPVLQLPKSDPWFAEDSDIPGSSPNHSPSQTEEARVESDHKDRCLAGDSVFTMNCLIRLSLAEICSLKYA